MVGVNEDGSVMANVNGTGVTESGVAVLEGVRVAVSVKTRGVTLNAVACVGVCEA
jgi:hypothetical protein